MKEKEKPIECSGDKYCDECLQLVKEIQAEEKKDATTKSQ